jgi:hypothetical protein
VVVVTCAARFALCSGALIRSGACAQVEHRYGLITGMFVLYRGESYVVDDIEYLNMEEYLRRLA